MVKGRTVFADIETRLSRSCDKRGACDVYVTRLPSAIAESQAHLFFGQPCRYSPPP